jgi:hypothetical protein
LANWSGQRDKEEEMRRFRSNATATDLALFDERMAELRKGPTALLPEEVSAALVRG